MVSDTNIQKRIDWMNEDSQMIRTGDIRFFNFNTSAKASRLSQFAAGQVPFLKAKVTAENILFVDFPVRSNYIDRMYIAQPMFTGVIGAGCKDYPVQVACTTRHNLPYTVATHKFSRKSIKFVSETGEQDPYIVKILNDGTLTQLPLNYTHIINKDEKMRVTYGMQVIPKSPFFHNKTLCTITSGTFRKTLNMYGRRIYQMDHYLNWLENIVRNLQELNYQGPTIKDTCYSSVYFIFHPEITNLNAETSAPTTTPQPTPSSGPNFCTKCGTPITTGFKFCKKCGNELPKEKVTKAKFCTSCGNKAIPGNKFCTYCGNEIKK